MKSEYRAWLKEKQQMWNVICINWELNEVELCLAGKYRVVPLCRVILMRNTGRQDISGEDVYEGDVLESHQGTQILDISLIVKYGKYQAYCPVDREYMDNIGFYVEAAGYQQMPLGNLEEYAKVIKNIYEIQQS